MSILALAVAATAGAVAAEGARRIVGGVKTALDNKKARELYAAAIEKTREIKIEEIIKFKLVAHGKCGGKGYFHKGKDEEGAIIAAPCTCAMERFLRRNADKLCKVAGEYRWRAVES